MAVLTLGEKQRAFTRAIGLLIGYAYMQGYELTFGDAYRDPRVHGPIGTKQGYGHRYSLHKYRLAVDFNLFINEEWVSDSTNAAWDDLHKFWELIGGAEAVKDDANHFSFEHNGMR